MALSTILPLVIRHFASNGEQADAQGQTGGLAQQILSRFL
jgi:hypothetical protein